MKSRYLIFVVSTLICTILHSAEEKQATISNGVKEADLATVTLTESAEKRLAIATEVVEKKQVPASRLFAGELVLADPAPADGQSIFSLLPQMTPAERLRIAEEQINADGILEAARVDLEAIQIEVDRAEKLLRQKVGAERAVDDAKAKYNLAQTALNAAKAKRELLGPAVLAARAPDLLWVKVPVYVGDLDRIDRKADALIGRLDGRPDGRPDGLSQSVKPVTAPPSADPTAATVDIYFEVKNPDRKLLPGQKMGVTVPLVTQSESLVAPHAAVLYDFNGGSWVYESLGSQVYTLRRVQISRVVGDRAVLITGPKPGAKVVTDGAAELFGTEFGVGK